MLAQLVCVDRRYQRMNCFNIRELQSMLKRRFFTDLVSSNDHREMLNNSMIGLRFKTNSNNALDADILNFYNYGTTLTPKTKSDEFYNLYTSYPTLNNDSLVYTAVNYIVWFAGSVYDFVNRLVLKTLVDSFSPTTSIITSFNSHYYNTILAFDDILFNTTRVIQNINVLSFPSIFTNTSMISEVISWNFNWNLSFNSPTQQPNTSTTTDNVLGFDSNNISTLSHSNPFSVSEYSNSLRFTRYNNPLINYSYKSGHYIGIWDKLYPSLMTSFIEVAKNVIKASWVYSPDFTALLSDNYKTFNSFFVNNSKIKTANINSWYSNHVQPIHNYFNVYSVTGDSNFLSTR